LLDVVVKDKAPALLPSQNQVIHRHILNLAGGEKAPSVRRSRHAGYSRGFPLVDGGGDLSFGSEWLDSCRKSTLRCDAIIPTRRLNLIRDRSHERIVIGEGVDQIIKCHLSADSDFCKSGGESIWHRECA